MQARPVHAIYEFYQRAVYTLRHPGAGRDPGIIRMDTFDYLVMSIIEVANE